ncbi:MAG TPA: hypothetical protein VFQ13_15125, partial [Anaerolineales bacterium]|nr:hypothetical protein [Anaerolineales bacterium]
MEHAVVAVLEALVERIVGLVPAPIAPALFHFVVAAPEGQGSMVAQAADVFHCLDAEVLEEVCVGGIDPAGEHKVLPDQNAITVAQ